MLKLKTRSGAEYTLDLDERKWWYGEDGPHMIIMFRLVDRVELTTKDNMWDYMNTLPKATEPEVGKSIYLSGTNYWRISTPIVSIEQV